MSLDSALYGLTQYVQGLEPIMVHSSYSGIIEYMDSKLLDYLIPYSNAEVIPRLESLLNILKAKTMQDVRILIPENKYWDWEKEVAKSTIKEEQKALFNGIKNTQGFISEIIRLRLKMIESRPPKLFYFTNNDMALNRLKNSLLSNTYKNQLNRKSNKRLIEDTEYFNAIFRGEAPNERINWTGDNKNHFCYFIKELFLKMFSHKANWEIVQNTFLFNGEPVLSDMDKNNSISEDDKKIINSILNVAFPS